MNSSTRNTRLCLFGFILLTFLLLKANAGKRIVGGEDVHRDDYGFFVAVKNNQRNWCAGSLIHSDMVLTAAHCDAPVSGLTAIVSAYTRNYIDQGHIPVNVIQRIPHPHFDRSLMKYDMALLKLEFPVYSVDPVQVNRNSSYPPAHASLKVAGLGDTSAGPGFHAPEVLQHVTVEVVDTDDCRRIYGLSVGESLKNEWNLCAMKSGKDSCQGDSGGPLLDQNGVLVGTTSWGVNCASETYPGVYARPDVHWIDEVICNLSDDKPSSCFESDESRSFTSPNSTTQPVSSSWPTSAPTNLSVTQPINAPTQWPTASPTKISTIPPTFNPSISPSNYPTTEPTVLPTVLHSSFSPSNYPSNFPTTKPTASPTVPPTSSSPTNQPSDFPTTEPTAFPTRYPTQPKRQFSADSPTSPSLPTLVSLDNLSTTTRPSQPSQWPTAYPTRLPRLGHALPSSSNTPSRQPNAGPSVSNLPSSAPSMKQQSQPPSVSGRPSNFPSISPSVDSTTPHTPTPLSPLVNQGFDSKTRLTQPSLCNDDIYTKFHVNNNHGMKGCFWLQARPELHEELCNDTHQAYHVCEETCGKCKDSCEDSENWIYFYVDEILRNCEWLYLRPHLQTEECQPGRKAQTLCPETCSACEK